MAELRRIKPHVEIALSEEFLAADDPREFVEIDEDRDTEPIGHDADLASLDSLIEDVISNFDRYDTSIDERMVIDLYESLGLDRRKASDRQMWAWLGVVRYPHLVAYRWRPRARTGLRAANRFAGDRVRQTFARLWWAAELTKCDERDFTLTHELFSLSGFQDVYEAIFGRAFCGYFPAMDAFVRVVGRRPEREVRETAKSFSYALSTLGLETMTTSELRELLKDLVSRLGAAAASE